jgi:hypothetical protein
MKKKEISGKLPSQKRVFEVRGKKIKGRYCLIKLKPKETEDKNWLFFKLKNPL